MDPPELSSSAVATWIFSTVFSSAQAQGFAALRSGNPQDWSIADAAGGQTVSGIGELFTQSLQPDLFAVEDC